MTAKSSFEKITVFFRCTLPLLEPREAFRSKIAKTDVEAMSNKRGHYFTVLRRRVLDNQKSC